MWLVFMFWGQYNFAWDRHHRCWRCNFLVLVLVTCLLDSQEAINKVFPSLQLLYAEDISTEKHFEMQEVFYPQLLLLIDFCAFYQISRKIFNQSIYFKLKSSFTTTWIISINVHWFKVFLTVNLTLIHAIFKPN